MAVETVLLVNESGDGTVAEVVSGLGLRLKTCAGTDVAASFQTTEHDLVAVVFGAGFPAALGVAREVYRLDPTVQMVFLADTGRVAEVRRQIGPAPRIGTHWSIAEPTTLERVLRDGVRSTQQRRRMRTTLDRAKIRVASRPPNDAPDYRKLVLSDRYLASVLTSAQDAILSTDPAGTILLWNRAAEKLFGHSATDAIGRPVTLLDPETAVIEGMVRAVRDGETEVRREVLLRRADGAVLYGEVTVAPVRDDAGQLVSVSMIVRDVSERKRAEAAIRQQREWLQITLTSIGDAVIATDTHARITFINPVAEALTGWPAGDAKGQLMADVFRIINEETRGPVANPAVRALSEGTIVGLANHTILIARDGFEYFIDDSAAPIRAEDGTVTGAVLVFRDVTEKKRTEQALRAQEQRALAILESITEAFFSLDRDWKFTYVNGPGGKLLGRPAGGLVGLSLWDEYPGVLGSVFEPVYRNAMDRQQEGSVTAFYPDHSCYYEVHAYPAPDGLSVYFQDVTERRRAEEEIRDADRKKDEFIALLAHELRNPLAPIRNGLQVIRMSQDRATRERSQAMMDRQLTHMVRLIDDLLDISRINRNKMELRRDRILLADAVGSAVETARPVIDAAGHQLEVDLPAEPVFLDADLTRLAQVFSNLLTNSAKYTDRGGKVWLSARPDGAEVVVTVRDTGIGIPAESLQNIFDMFSQVDRSVERTTGGLGIGLALVKGFVEMHGGTVSAASGGQDRGSEFTVRLPVLPVRVEVTVDAPVGSNGVRHGPKRRILVVDDNRDSAESLAMMLDLFGHDVALAHDGLEAVERAGAYRPAVILMDVGMPRLNGLDATRRIREQPWGRDVVIIALTGWGQDADRERTREAGCNGHLVKPVSMADLGRALGASDTPLGN